MTLVQPLCDRRITGGMAAQLNSSAACGAWRAAPAPLPGFSSSSAAELLRPLDM